MFQTTIILTKQKKPLLGLALSFSEWLMRLYFPIDHGRRFRMGFCDKLIIYFIVEFAVGVSLLNKQCGLCN